MDADEYIAAVRTGLLEPYGKTADELQEELDSFDAELDERLLAMTAEQVDAGAQLPPLSRAPESALEERLRLDEEFVARIAQLELQQARIEGARRSLMAEHMQRLIMLPTDAGPAVKELATMAAVEVGLTQGSMIGRMTESWTVVTELAAAHAASAEGRITTAHLRVIEQQTRPLRLDSEVAPAEKTRVIAELVELAERVSTSQLRQRAKQTVNDVLTEPLQIRHDTARQRRRLELFDAGDGMGDLLLHAPILELTAIMDRGTQAARKKPKDDPRTFDQFRADAAQELLLAGIVPEDLHGISPIKAQVAITIPATELLHDKFEQDPAMQDLGFPAMLNGKTLIDRDTARRIAADTATWQRLFTDPVTGVPVTVDSRRATAAQQQWLFLRDTWCRGPGCAKSAMRTDLDHTKDWALGGSTSLDNLEHLCRADHGLKHDTRWTVEQLPGGVMRWRSPIGQVITDEVEPVGPVFTDMPRTPSKPPKLTRAQRRQRRKEQLERLRVAEAEWQQRRKDGTLPPAEFEPRAGTWGGVAADAAMADGSPLPF